MTEHRDSSADIHHMVLPFPGSVVATIPEVGGKAYSLIQLAAAGRPVPPGVVLTSRFFDPWVEVVLAGTHWSQLQSAAPKQWPALCSSLKQQAAVLPLSELQLQAVDAMRRQLDGLTAAALFAVRSSSPQEDLQGASFAGGYETRLGVAPADLFDAVRACFASTFDERVFAYKVASGLERSSPRMAVVVQAQLDSEVAGVAFSINPLNNDYDQAVINANWGQGETVVAGQVTPDHWVVDKPSGTIVQRSINLKALSRWLQAAGGLIDRQGARQSEACLTDGQIAALLAEVKCIEAIFAQPVDVEWAIAAGTLHVLQARPVTAFVPLPASLLTVPGERRRLYMDIALSSGLTINAPISVMGLSVFQRLFSGMARIAFGRIELAPGVQEQMIVLDGGRVYLDLSNVMWLGGPRLLARKLEIHDALLARALASIDPCEYRSIKRPSWAGLGGLRLVPRAWWRLRHALGNLVLPFIAPERMYRRIARQLEAWESEISADIDTGMPLNAFWDRYVASRLQALVTLSLPVVGPGVLAVRAFNRLAGRITRGDADLASRLDRGFEGNVVVAMSVQMHRLAWLLPNAQLRDADELARKLRDGELPDAFVAEWNRFLACFGCRGPMEMDIAHPRYADWPQMALKQVAAMSGDSNYDPAAASAVQVARRQAAVTTVTERAGPLRRLILRRLDRVIECFAGYRDTPKLHLLMILHGVRRRIAVEGEALHRDGRIDAPEHVYDFDIDELVAAAADSSLDLRVLRAERCGYYDRLASQVVNFPPLIDSRGRIVRAPRGPRREGELCGVALSPGLVSGRARTLRSPHEGPLLKGEVLIAYTTDPGWTPIFANATAIVLEIGGALQHGAVVARELGLPCVAGIEGITTALKDGQVIEVNGSTGTVRLLRASD